jgi:hypothetical protein
MVTKAQLDRFASRIDGLTSALGGPDEPIKVTVFRGETAAFAMERHRTLRPEHAGRLVRFVYMNDDDRTEINELYAVSGATPEEEAELKVWVDKLLVEIDEKMRDNILSLPTTPEEVEEERAFERARLQREEEFVKGRA